MFSKVVFKKVNQRTLKNTCHRTSHNKNRRRLLRGGSVVNPYMNRYMVSLMKMKLMSKKRIILEAPTAKVRVMESMIRRLMSLIQIFKNKLTT